MAIEIQIDRVQVKHNSNKTLEFAFHVKSWFGGPSYLVGIQGTVGFNQETIANQIGLKMHQMQMGTPIYLDANQSVFGQFEVVLTNEALKYIETMRRENDVQLSFKIIYQWQALLSKPADNLEAIAGKLPVGGVRWHETETHLNIARSSWVDLLNKLKYSEIELFEINKLAFSVDDNLKQAFNYISGAQSQMRAGNYDGVLADCKSALESAAKYVSKGNVKRGFDLIVDLIFPSYEDKQKAFNQVLKSISDYSQFGRHAGFPHVPIMRDEAEFIYISTLNAFAFISSRMEKK